jgi:hypothetical protein
MTDKEIIERQRKVIASGVKLLKEVLDWTTHKGIIWSNNAKSYVAAYDTDRNNKLECMIKEGEI